eukprot:jgi/Astpho2/8689/Aster-05259
MDTIKNKVQGFKGEDGKTGAAGLAGDAKQSYQGYQTDAKDGKVDWGTQGKDAAKTYGEGFKHEEVATACPILCFINPKSGSQYGVKLLEQLDKVLGAQQVFLLPKQKPDEVLKKLWGNLHVAMKEGDHQAEQALQSLRLIAAGGDGTISWILQAVRQAQLTPEPPVSVMPLGTGNGVARNLGWGKKINKKWISSPQAVAEVLKDVAEAKVRDLDMWQITLACNVEQQKAEDLPDDKLTQPQQVELAVGEHVPEPGLRHYDKKAHKLQQKHTGGEKKERTPSTEEHSVLSGHLPAALHPADCPANQDTRVGQFSYYLTVGLDAEAAYRFDQIRKHQPHLAKHRWQNIFWYGAKAAQTGWLCGGKPLIKHDIHVKIRASKDGAWQDMHVPKDVRALVVLNFQSYSGGKDIWGLHDHQWPDEKAKGLKKPIFDDNCIEVIGLKGGLHTAGVLAQISPHWHGERLGQAYELDMTLHAAEGVPGRVTHMRLDGEAWEQPLPQQDEQPLTVHISLAGSARVLLNTHKLPGITKKASMLAEREVKYSTPEVDRQRGLDNSTRQSLDSQSDEETEPQHPSST